MNNDVFRFKFNTLHQITTALRNNPSLESTILSWIKNYPEDLYHLNKSLYGLIKLAKAVPNNSAIIIKTAFNKNNFVHIVECFFRFKLVVNSFPVCNDYFLDLLLSSPENFRLIIKHPDDFFELLTIYPSYRNYFLRYFNFPDDFHTFLLDHVNVRDNANVCKMRRHFPLFANSLITLMKENNKFLPQDYKTLIDTISSFSEQENELIPVLFSNSECFKVFSEPSALYSFAKKYPLCAVLVLQKLTNFPEQLQRLIPDLEHLNSLLSLCFIPVNLLNKLISHLSKEIKKQENKEIKWHQNIQELAIIQRECFFHPLHDVKEWKNQFNKDILQPVF